MGRFLLTICCVFIIYQLGVNCNPAPDTTAPAAPGALTDAAEKDGEDQDGRFLIEGIVAKGIADIVTKVAVEKLKEKVNEGKTSKDHKDEKKKEKSHEKKKKGKEVDAKKKKKDKEDKEEKKKEKSEKAKESSESNESKSGEGD